MKIGTKLHLGCGREIREGWVNLDMLDLPGVDVVRDVLRGLPFNDETFEFIFSSNVLEHIPQSESIWIMNEIWRVTKFGGQFHCILPTAGTQTYYENPTHLSNWTANTISFFVKGHKMNVYYDGIKGWKLIRLNRARQHEDMFEFILEKV